MTVNPSRYQTPSSPVDSFCQRRSALPSPLTSPTPWIFQLKFETAHYREPSLIDHRRAIQHPHAEHAVRLVLPHEIGLAIAVDVACARDDPVCIRILGTLSSVAAVALNPFISQTASQPSSCCQMMSALPSPFTSATPRIFQPVSRGSSSPRPGRRRSVPRMSHTATVPSLVFCHTRSANPSPLRSPLPSDFPCGSAGCERGRTTVSR